MVEHVGAERIQDRVVAHSFPEFVGLSNALRDMQFMQADPIRSPARAQDLMLRQRVVGYVAGGLEETFPDLEVEEGYLFAYGFMAPEVWHNLRWRPRRKLTKRERAVLEPVAEQGEVHPRGLDERFGRKSVENYWGGKSQETKQIFERLHHLGYLRVSLREKGIHVYQAPDNSTEDAVVLFERFTVLASTTASRQTSAASDNTSARKSQASYKRQKPCCLSQVQHPLDKASQ